MAKTVEILIYDGMNELDFATMFDVLAAVEVVMPGGRVPQRGFQVDTVADRVSPIETTHGIRMTPHKGLSGTLGASILVVPGGPGARRPHLPQSVVAWLTRNIERTELVAACSTGVYILGRAGLINDRRVTTHYRFTEDLHRQYPRARVVSNVRIAADGRNLLTAAGGTASADLALAIVQRFYGPTVAHHCARRIEYEVEPGRADTAKEPARETLAPPKPSPLLPPPPIR